MQEKPIFVVGTGRCGSTLLSNMISLHPDILSLSEFFVSLSPYGFTKKIINGRAFWEMLSTPRAKVDLMMKHRIGIPEFLYSSDKGVPPILLMTLPHLTNEPEVLFEELQLYVLTLPEDALSTQYIRLFEYLKKKFNKQIWIERSGGSLRYITKLLELYPNAKFVHMYRDGRECAMSMRRHNAFRLTMVQTLIKEKIGKDPFADSISEAETEKLGELSRLLPDRFERDAFNLLDIPIERFGSLWSSQILQGVQYLKQVPPSNMLHLSYEKLLSNPEEELSSFLQFVLPNHEDQENFIRKAADLVQSNKKDTWRELSQEEQENLTRACKLGLRLLRYA